MPVKPVTKEEILKSNGVETFDTYNPLYENVKRAMDSWAALQTGERDAEIERLKGLIKKLWALDVTYTTWKQFCETNKL